MGDHNSSLTRVQPVFDELLDQWPDGDPWLSELWDMAALTRPGVTLSKPVGLGRLLASETPPARAARRPPGGDPDVVAAHLAEGFKEIPSHLIVE